MDGCSLHSLSFIRRPGSLKRLNMTSLCFVLLAFYLTNAKCATLEKAPDRNVPVKHENRTFEHRQLSPFNFVSPNLIANTPASFGFPLYANPAQGSSFHHVPFQQFVTSPKPKVFPKDSDKKQSRVKESDIEFEKELQLEDDSKDAKSKPKKVKKKQPKPKVEEKAVATIEESKVGGNGETPRNCPACVGGECNAHMDTHTNIAGIPIIQILIAGGVGAAWAAIFLFILFNFIDRDKHHEEGGYDTPVYGAPHMPHTEYGTPQTEYGSPHPQQEYGTPQQEYGSPQQAYGSPSSPSSSYDIHRIANRHGRKNAQGFSFNDMTSWVATAIDKFTKLYGEKDSG